MRTLLLYATFLLLNIAVKAQQVNQIGSTGPVGVGISLPTYTLHIKGAPPSPHFGLVAIQDASASGTLSNAYLNFLGANNNRVSYIGPNAGSLVLMNEQTNTVAISPYLFNDGTKNYAPKVLIGSAATINSNNNNSTLEVHGTTFFRDKIGIGTTNPYTQLEVRGAIFSANTQFNTGVFFSADNANYGLLQAQGSTDPNLGNPMAKTLALQLHEGKVGIGTSSPNSKLDVMGDFGLRDGHSIYFYTKGDLSFSEMFNDDQKNLTFKSGNSGVRFQAVADMGFQIWNGTAFADRLKIQSDGKVGIGTSYPQSELAVNGTITTKKVMVTQANWPDYVFDTNYKIPSLRELETFIKKNKHLPNIPSAQQVKKDGIDLGDNQAMLLKKIEELTLYVIQQGKRMEVLEEQLKTLQGIDK